MNDDIKYKELKRKISREEKKHEVIQKKIKLLENELPELYKLKNELSELSHKYKQGQLVVLKGTPNIAEITKLIGRKHYQMFIQCEGLRTGLGTSEKKHESDILCKVEQIRLTRCTFDISGLPIDRLKETK